MSRILDNQPPVTFRRKLKKKKKKKPSFKKLMLVSFLSLFLLVLFSGFVGAGFIFFYYSQDLPDVRSLKEYQPSTITRVYSDQDELIAEFYIEKRIIVPLKTVPKQLKQATLAVEDSNFYSHFGIDPKAIFRAFLTNIQAGHVVEGGSTITQQLAKTLFLSSERSLERKIREAILSVRMELVFSKDEILEMYLNNIYYGHGSYGVEAAARTYFGKSVKDLSLVQCATLAALPKAPNNYSPYRYPKKSLKRRNHVLKRMVILKNITQDEKEAALKASISLGEITDMLNKAPYFVEHIRQFIQENYGSNKLYREGLNVYTTLNLQYQNIATAAVRKGLLEADKRYGYRGPVNTINLDDGRGTIVDTLSELNKLKEGIKPKAGDLMHAAVLQVFPKEVVDLGFAEGSIALEKMSWARKPDIRLDGRWARINNAHQALKPGDIIQVRLLNQNQDGDWDLALEQTPEVQGGLISLNPLTGQILSMVGGYDFKDSQFNRAIQAIRQPGSAFKPIIYTAALQEGYTPASIIIDAPLIFNEKEDTFDKWKPVNFEENFYGLIFHSDSSDPFPQCSHHQTPSIYRCPESHRPCQTNFVALSFSMFGFYDLQMPASIQSKLTNISNSQQGGNIIGVAIMGFLSALIVGPCVTAPLVGALIYIAETGDAVLGGMALFSLSMGMGAPLLLIGASAGKLLPKAGAWMDAVKAVFGVLLIGLAIWLLERVAPVAVTMAMWAALIIVSAIYMGAIDGITEGSSGWKKLWKGVGVVLLIYGIIILIGLASGNRNVFQPLKGLAGASGQNSQVEHLSFKQIKGVEGLNVELAKAKAAGKPVMLDFYADWCVSCKEMEVLTFADPAVQNALKEVILLQADVTPNDNKDTELYKHFGIIGPPSIMFFGADGIERRNYRVVGYMPAEKFSPHIKRALN